jgi:excisionase family DNA binding protein
MVRRTIKYPRVLLLHEKEQFMDPLQFFTIDEAASILRVSRGTVHRNLSGGEIPAVRLGKRVLIPVWFKELTGKALPESTDELPEGK